MNETSKPRVVFQIISIVLVAIPFIFYYLNSESILGISVRMCVITLMILTLLCRKKELCLSLIMILFGIYISDMIVLIRLLINYGIQHLLTLDNICSTIVGITNVVFGFSMLFGKFTSKKLKSILVINIIFMLILCLKLLFDIQYYIDYGYEAAWGNENMSSYY